MTELTFDDMVGLVSREDTIAVIAIGKVAKAPVDGAGRPIGSFNDIDLLVIGSSGRAYTREVSRHQASGAVCGTSDGIDGTTVFDISRIDIMDLEGLFESKNALWVGIVGGSRILRMDAAWSEKIDEIVGGFGRLLAEGPGLPTDSTLSYLRSKAGDYRRRLSEAPVCGSPRACALNEDLLASALHFIKSSCFELKGIWKPKEKNLMSGIEDVHPELWEILIRWLGGRSTDGSPLSQENRVRLAIDAIDILFEGVGGTICEYPEGEYPLLR